MKKIQPVLFISIIIFMISCNDNGPKKETKNVVDATDSLITKIPSPKNFQTTIDGELTNLYILKNGNMQVAITNYGARIVSIIVPDKKGILTDVTVGYDSIDPYTKGSDTYFGAVVGRYGNRIAKGKFSLEGRDYKLATNNGINHLHGGNKGFSRVVWLAKKLNDSTLTLQYISKDGEEGYPGNLNAMVTYTLLPGNQLKINYSAITDKATVLNLTNHTYFNLNGQGSGTINDHLVMIDATSFTPVDSTLIPTGKFEKVEGTPFNFTKPVAIGSEVNDSLNQQIKYGHGYDHNFVLNTAGNINKKAAEVVGDKSGIVMDVYTTQPGLQFYGGNFMDGSHAIKYGKKDDYRSAFCMETQHYPNSPNQPNFPSTELKPRQQYNYITIYSFSNN